MAKYLPGSITPEEVYVPDPTGVSELLEEDIRQYIKWLDQVVAKGIEGKLETADDYYDVAVLYAKIRYDKGIVNQMPDIWNADSSKRIIDNINL